MDRLEKEEEAARLAREIQLRQSQKLQVGGDAMMLFMLADWHTYFVPAIAAPRGRQIRHP